MGGPGADGDYPPDLYDFLSKAEDKHFWFRARTRLIVATLREILGELRGRSALDVGCGSGQMLAVLERAGMDTTGIDMNLAGLMRARAKTRGLLVHQMAREIPFVRQFDVVTLCDVIEHVDDDTELLRQAAGAVTSGGIVLVTVPALPILWSRLDERWGHKRRYTRSTLAASLRRAGIQTTWVRYFNLLLLPVFFLTRLPPKLWRAPDSEAGFSLPPTSLDLLLGAILALDVRLSRIGFPTGASLIAVGRPA